MICASESLQLRDGDQNAPAYSPEFQLPVCQQVIDGSNAERKSDCRFFAAHQQFCVRWNRIFGRRLFLSLPALVHCGRFPNDGALNFSNLRLGSRYVRLDPVIGSALNCRRLEFNGIRQLVLGQITRSQGAF